MRAAGWSRPVPAAARTGITAGAGIGASTRSMPARARRGDASPATGGETGAGKRLPARRWGAGALFTRA
ncbi:Hypothetical protein I596_2658 [Dokdonella koreensis DS-123]|uniref:Uncharacterized protein n=1 Tax=Dokdonella koreensis DS-123 TaxID=1300342 RepID=A0A160DW66_9GAMM|nr:Hypothetical protein I596_2658 [Dokdonella koreensis DS-123]